MHKIYDKMEILGRKVHIWWRKLILQTNGRAKGSEILNNREQSRKWSIKCSLYILLARVLIHRKNSRHSREGVLLERPEKSCFVTRKSLLQVLLVSFLLLWDVFLAKYLTLMITPVNIVFLRILTVPNQSNPRK